MRPVRHALALAGVLAVAAVPAVAGAEILDIRAERTGDEIGVLFVFDSQPADASITISGTEALATIAGAHGSDRLLRPDASGLRQISVADRPLGLSVGAVAQRAILTAEAEVFRNAVLFRLTLTPGGPAETPEAASAAAAPPAPADAPEGSPESATGEAPAPDPEQFAEAAPSEPPPQPQFPESAAPAAEQAEDSAALAAALEAAAAEAEAALAAAETEAEAEQAALADAEASAATDSATGESAATDADADETPETEAEMAAAGPQWAQGDALWQAPAPLSPSPPGAASELLAAQLDSAACAAAAATVAADPWALDALYNHGACLARDGHRARAQEVFERLAVFDPTSARTMVALGVLRQDAGDRAAAQDYYERAMATAPDDGLAVLVRMLREL